ARAAMPEGAGGRASGSSKKGISSGKPDILLECSDSPPKGQKCLCFVLVSAECPIPICFPLVWGAQANARIKGLIGPDPTAHVDGQLLRRRHRVNFTGHPLTERFCATDC